MMIKIDAIVREEKFEDVKAALNAIGVNGITVSQVMGCGVQRKRSIRKSSGAWKWQCRCFRKSNLKSWYASEEWGTKDHRSHSEGSLYRRSRRWQSLRL